MLTRCPNCDALMVVGRVCPCCGHCDDVDCDCTWCLESEEEEEE